MASPNPKPSESPPEFQIPPPTASPSEVRSYFAGLLSTLHTLPEEDAKATASRWKLGRGEEMLSHDIETYRQIFDWEAGTVLFGHVNRKQKKRVQSGEKEGTRSKRGKDIFGLEPGLSLIYICFIAMIGLAWQAYVEPDDMRAVTFAMLSAMFLLGFGGTYCGFYFT